MGEDDTEEEKFRFFFDFRQYWCNPLGDAFGVSEKSIEKLVTEVLIDHWAVSSRGRAEDDTRHTLKLYPEGSYVHKGEWPDEEDLDFYLAIQALCEGRDPGDLTTIEDPGALEQIRASL